LPDRFNPQAIAIAAELAESEVTSMITTVTLNASIDKAYRINMPLTRGTVIRVAECEDSAGGKGLNAARAIAGLVASRLLQRALLAATTGGTFVSWLPEMALGSALFE
jgi:fructose-1-phosphate kinase PfkB-like protein